MEAKKIFIFASLIIVVLFSNVGKAQAEYNIDNSDVPINEECSMWHAGYIDAAITGNEWLGWGPDKWDNPEATKWAPEFAGIKVSVKTQNTTVRFVFSQEQIDFYSSVFLNTNSRIPYALEIDVVDYNSIFGEKEVDDFYIYRENVSDETPIKIDVSAYDDENQMSVFIPRPDLLKPYKVYEIVLRPNSPKFKVGKVQLNFQLTVNYKWLAFMKYMKSEKCDVLTMIDYVKDEMLNNDETVEMLVDQKFGSDIPEKAIHGWYYYIVAKTDDYVPISVSVSGETTPICSDDIRVPAHNLSGPEYCNCLFDVKPGSRYGEFIKFSNSPKVYYLSGKRLYWVIDEKTFYEMGNDDFSGVIEYDASLYYNQITDQFPIVNNGFIAKVPESSSPEKVYMFKDNQWHWFTSWDVFTSYGFTGDDIIDISLTVFKMYNEGTFLDGDEILIAYNSPYCLSSSSSVFEDDEPIDLPYTFYRSAFCTDIETEDPYSPIGEKETFYEGDRSILWFKLNNVNIPIEAKAEFYLPDGSLYNTDVWDEINIPNGNDYIFWSTSKYISEYGGCYTDTMQWQGQWTVKIYINNELVDTNTFTIQYDQVATTIYYRDWDGDGYSNGKTQIACTKTYGHELPEDLIATSGDCNDYDNRVHPDALEFCSDGIDQDCDGQDNFCPPNGIIDTPGKDITVVQGTPIYFSGTGIDIDNQLPLAYFWDFGGGTANSTLEDPGNVYFNEVGTYTVTFTATDANGLSDPTPDVITVNVVPSSSIVVPDDYSTIQAAVNAANDGDTIIVRNGNYYGSVNFSGKSITLVSENGPEFTRIQCPSGYLAAVNFDNSYGNSSPKIIGFTIIAYYNYAIFCRSSSPVIENCILGELSRNGAIHGTLSDITVKDCAISGNHSSSNGGGIYVDNSTLTVIGSTISGNKSSTSGGGIYGKLSAINLSDSEISENTSTNGGGIYGDYLSLLSVSGCIILNNTASYAGGGIYFTGSDANFEVENSLLIKNTASSTGYGGAIYLDSYIDATFTNSTIADNIAGQGSGIYNRRGGIYEKQDTPIKIVNSVIWQNTVFTYPTTALEQPDITYSIVQNGYIGEGNINKDPLFVDAANNDYKLQATSPCVDFGTANNAPLVDLDNADRPNGFGFDIGAYEYVYDCEGQLAEEEFAYFKDTDNDGYSDGTTITQADRPDGYKLESELISMSGDCDDTNPNIHPNAIETCNEKDDDCDSQIDEGVKDTYYRDDDNDNYGDINSSIQSCTTLSGYVNDNTDCLDTDPEINPGATDICDGVNNNCDFYVDENFDVGEPCSVGIGACRRAGNKVCSDNGLSTVCNAVSGNPGAEVCNGVDDNCDGQIDENLFQSCGSDVGSCKSGIQTCSNGSWGSCEGEIGPIAEVCNGKDDDCDGVVDDGVDKIGYYVDGWHTDGTSQAFMDCYTEFSIFLGSPFDNGGSIYVHRVGIVWAQDFKQDISKPHYGDDGQSCVILNEKIGKAFLVKEGFWGKYKEVWGFDNLGAPICNETNEIDLVVRQDFEKGYMTWDGQTIKVYWGSSI